MDWDAEYREHQPGVFSWLYRKTGLNTELARDLTQDVFVRAMRNEQLFRYDDGRGVAPWLMVIARNALADHLRKHSTHRETLVPVILDDGAPLAEAAEVLALRNLDVEHALTRVGALPARQRQALMLAAWGGLPLVGIADRMGTSVSSVKLLKFRARRQLREHRLLEVA